MMNTILVAILFSALFVAYIIMQRRKIADGKAMFWATVSEPIEYVMDDPEKLRRNYPRCKCPRQTG